MPNPHSLVTQRPTQKSYSIAEYWKIYNHYIMLRALIEDNPTNVTHKHEMKHFVNGCKYSDFLEGELRREEHIHAVQHKFQPQNMVNTLNGYLLLSNSPTAKSTPKQSSSNYYRNRRTSSSFNQSILKNPYRKKTTFAKTPDNTTINQLSIEDDDTTHSDNDDNNTDDDSSIETNTDDTLEYALHTTIAEIKRNPAAAEAPCLVCEVVFGQPPKDNHRFEQCKVLNNHAVLKKQFVSICSAMRRTRNAIKNRAIKQIQHETNNDDDTPTQDFP